LITKNVLILFAFGVFLVSIVGLSFISEAQAASPISNAGGAYSGEVGLDLILDGSASYDSDPGDSIVKYDWRVLNDVGTIPLIALTNGGVNPVVTAAQTQSLGSGFYTVDLTVTDTTGTFSTNSVATLVLTDTIPPVVTPPANITVESTGQFTTISIGTATAIDLGDPNPSVASDAPANYPVGTTTVTWTALDKNGNVGTAIQTITVTEAATTAFVPSFPTGLTVTNVSDTTVTVSWITPGDGGSPITGYMMEKSTVPISAMQTHLANTGTTTTTFTYTGLTPNTEYAFDVAAVNAIGYSPPSARVTTTTSAGETAPDVPSGLTVTGVTSTTVTVSWTAPVNNGGSPITGYMMEKSTVPISAMQTHLANTGTITTIYTYTGLTPNTEYAFDVAAINAIGYSPPSSRVTTTTLTSVNTPGAPTSLTVTNTSESSITVSWTAPADTGGATITGYMMEKSTVPISAMQTHLANTGTTTTTFTYTGLTPNTEYAFDVAAVNSQGYGSPSDRVIATTLSITPSANFGFDQQYFDTIFYTTTSTGNSVDDVLSAHDGATSVPVLCDVSDWNQFSVGTTSVTCNATSSGQTITMSWNITFVLHTTPPTLTIPPDLEVLTFSNGFGGTYVPNPAPEAQSDIGDVVYLDCIDGANGESVLYYDDNSLVAGYGIHQTKGAHTITCTATDVIGNITTDSYTITFVDNGLETILPTLSFDFMASILKNTDDVSGAIVSFDNPKPYDSIAGKNIEATCTPASGSIFAPGSTIVTCVAQAVDGTPGQITFGVTIQTTGLVDELLDSQSMFSPQQSDMVIKANTPTGANVNYPVITWKDPYTGEINPAVCFPPAGTLFKIGSTTVVCHGGPTNKPGIISFLVTVESSLQTPQQTGITIQLEGRLIDIEINTNKNIIYVATDGCQGSNSCLYLIDGSTNKIITKTVIDRSTEDIAYNEKTNKIYTASPGSSIFVIDGTSGSIDTRISVCDSVDGVGLDTSTNTIFVNCESLGFGSKRAHEIDGNTNTVTETSFLPIIEPSPNSRAENTITKTVYTLNKADSTLEIFSETANVIAPATPRPPVPDWLKNNVQWWADGTIDDNSFKQGLSYMIKENIISIKDLPQSSGVSETKIPEWIKQNAKWWADGTIGEDEFINGLKYMVEKGIIGVN